MNFLGHLAMDDAALSPNDIVIEAGEGSLWRYSACGLGNIVVRGGITENKEFGGWFKFDDLIELHNKIADAVLELPMTGTYFRFIRKEMFLTAEEAASLCGVEVSVVDRWEDGGFTNMQCETAIREAYSEYRRTGQRPAVGKQANVA